MTSEQVSSVLLRKSSTVIESSSGISHKHVKLMSSRTASIRQSKMSVTYTTKRPRYGTDAGGGENNDYFGSLVIKA